MLALASGHALPGKPFMESDLPAPMIRPGETRTLAFMLYRHTYEAEFNGVVNPRVICRQMLRVVRSYACPLTWLEALEFEWSRSHAVRLSQWRSSTTVSAQHILSYLLQLR